MANGFIDKARITVRAGNGGNGAVAFHREKYIAAGGPDGGDGGSGGSIILKVDDNMSTLMDFRYKRKYVAGNGVDGQGGRKTGKDGESLTIKVPRGTLVRDAESGEIIKDMSDDKPYVLCRGGRGGWGNQHFATPTRQVPRFAKAGLPGESHDVILELKLLADVGLIGFPNVGKSTLLSVVSKAHDVMLPKDDATLMIATILNAYLTEVDKLQARHEKGLTRLMAEKTDAYVAGVQTAVNQLSTSLSSASVEGIRKVFDDHAARLATFKSNVTLAAVVVGLSALLNVAVFILKAVR